MSFHQPSGPFARECLPIHVRSSMVDNPLPKQGVRLIVTHAMESKTRMGLARPPFRVRKLEYAYGVWEASEIALGNLDSSRAGCVSSPRLYARLRIVMASCSLL